MTPARRKHLALLIVLVGGALLAARVVSLALSDPEASAPVAPRARAGVASASAPAAAAGAGSRVQLERLEARQRALDEGADGAGLEQRPLRPALFEIVAWQPPPPKAPPPPPPPKPVAPPFPYAYLGGLSEAGVRTSFFSHGNRVIAVKAGDTVDAAYRIEQMTETQMTLTYLPLAETMVVALGAGS